MAGFVKLGRNGPNSCQCIQVGDESAILTITSAFDQETNSELPLSVVARPLHISNQVPDASLFALGT